jgi:hypothetical protein
MGNSHIEEWDLRGWMGVEEPTPNAQREWNKTLIYKIMMISNKIHQSSRRNGADTIIIHPELEVLLHPDLYDDFRKKLSNGIDVILDPTMEKDRIEINCRKVLEDLRVIPFITEGDEETMGTIEFKPIVSCTDEQILKYVESLIGFILIGNV